MQCVVFKSSDVIYGILPPFHSFGFSVAGLFAFVSGTRIAFYPDPTDGFALAEGIHRWKVTVFCSAPSFLKGLFYAAEPEQLMSIRYFVCGAEKAPPELFKKVENLGSHGKLIEGYGITECSPIITISRPNLPPKGVGRILPNLQIRTIHPETQEPLPEGTEGEICVRGPSVFHGYLDHPRTPFIDLDGQKWYRTGDLGHLESDGSLILSGRLKRFTKLGGEMISLGAVEQALVSHFLQAKKMTADLPSIAICADERSGKPLLIVFTTLDIEKEEANRILEQAGFSRLIKISKVEKIDAIPLLGVGKTDYRKLQGMIV
jgi:long-chain-fatty-acid--[acyl-carrier-protein] ligase